MTKSKTMIRVVVALTMLLVTAVIAWAVGAFTVTATMNNYTGTTPNSLQSDGTLSASYVNKSGVSSNLTPTTGGGTN